MKVKTIKDYYQQIQELYPEVPLHDIKKALNYGWKIFYLYNTMGADTLIKDNQFWCYSGYLKKNSLDYFNYYIKKLAIKIRILYKRKRIPWDGYYYFALSESAQQKVLEQQNTKGRKRKKFDYGNVILYQIQDECKLIQHQYKYIYRIPYISNIGTTSYIPHLVTDKAELILSREPLQFKDILINTNEYEVL